MTTARGKFLRRNAEAVKHIESLMDLVADVITKLKANRRGSDPGRGLQLSPEVERHFRKRHPLLLRKLRNAVEGKSTPESRAFFKSYRDLAAKFRISPRESDPNLAVLAAVWLVEVVEYANKLSKRLERIKRTSGRTTRRDVRLELGMAYGGELCLLRRRVNALWSNIPRLIEHLGGNPSEDLMMGRKRVARKPGPPVL